MNLLYRHFLSLFLLIIFLKYSCIIYVTSVQYSDSQFLKIILHLQLLWNIGYIPCVVQYILVAYFVHDSLYFLIPCPCIAPPTLRVEWDYEIVSAQEMSVNWINNCHETFLYFILPVLTAIFLSTFLGLGNRPRSAEHKQLQGRRKGFPIWSTY